MNLKLLFVILDNEKKINFIINKFKLPFNTVTHGIGTASKSILDFFGLVPSEKVVLLSLIPDYLENDIVTYLRSSLKLEEIGNGIAFVVPLSSSSKYITNAFNNKDGEKKMIQERKYHLIVTIVQEGYADKVMNAAKKSGANGGTLIKGRGLGGKNSFKFFNMTMEPEKDVVLIVCDDNSKTKIMNSILEKTGLKTDGKALCFSLPIDSTVGIDG